MVCGTKQQTLKNKTGADIKIILNVIRLLNVKRNGDIYFRVCLRNTDDDGKRKAAHKNAFSVVSKAGEQSSFNKSKA